MTQKVKGHWVDVRVSLGPHSETCHSMTTLCCMIGYQGVRIKRTHPMSEVEIKIATKEGHPERQVVMMGATASQSVAPYRVDTRLSMPLSSLENSDNAHSPTAPSWLSTQHPSVRSEE